MKDKKIRLLLFMIFIVSAVVVGSAIMLYIQMQKGTNTTNNPITNVNNTQDTTAESGDPEGQSSGDIPIDEGMRTSNADYIILKQCVNGFLNTINKNNTAYYGADGTKTISDDEIAKMELDLLSQSYINKNNINVKNINQYIYNINTATFFILTDVKQYYGTEQVNSFVVKGLVENTEYKPLMEVTMILNIDTTQATYSVEILNNNTSIDAVTPTKLEKIDSNDVNEFQYIQLTDENIVKETVNTFKQTILGYPEVCYNKFMPAEYKQAKFANANAFKTYVQRNRELIEQINIKGYQKIDGGNRTTYILVDQYQNRYILNYRSMIDYTMTLDYYTIAVDTFKNAYDSADEDVKVSTQINKLQQMLNFKDYNAIYSKLNATFRNNNYQNVNKLAQYLAKNTYAINTIEVNNMEQRDGYYICTCTLKNQKNTQEQKNMTIMIKLNDYNNFEMSFSM